MGIISADVVHNISTPKHGAKVTPQPITDVIVRVKARQMGIRLGGLLKVS